MASKSHYEDYWIASYLLKTRLSLDVAVPRRFSALPYGRSVKWIGWNFGYLFLTRLVSDTPFVCCIPR